MNGLSNIGELIQRWERGGITLLPPHGEQKVVDELRRLGRPFSRDVVSLYCATGGMKDGAMDDEGLTLWPLDYLVAENLSRARPQILFMDFLIDSYFYGFQYEDAETSSVYADYYDGEPARRVAESLREFIEIYLNDTSKLFLWGQS